MKEKNNNLPVHISAEQTEIFLKNQEKSLENQSKELELKKQADENSFKFATANLQAQARDRDEQRKVTLSIINRLCIFFGVLAFLITAIIIFAISYSYMDIAMEIIKTIGTFSIAAFGGYQYGKSKSKNNGQE